MAETVRDFCNKVNIAQKEAGEAAYWLTLIRQSDMVPARHIADLEDSAVAIKKICREVVRLSRSKK